MATLRFLRLIRNHEAPFQRISFSVRLTNPAFCRRESRFTPKLKRSRPRCRSYPLFSAFFAGTLILLVPISATTVACN